MNDDLERRMALVEKVVRKSEARVSPARTGGSVPASSPHESLYEFADTMEIGLCAHGDETLPTDTVRSWFDSPEWHQIMEILKGVPASSEGPTTGDTPQKETP